MNPMIGTRYIEMSPEGMFLDSLSIVRLRDRASGKPIADGRAIAIPKKPKKPALDAAEHSVRRYERSMVAYNSIMANIAVKRDVHDKLVNEFRDTPFMFHQVDIKFNGRVISTDTRLFAILRRMNGGEVRADSITGSLFDESGACLSSDRLFIVGEGSKSTLKQRLEYFKARKEPESQFAQ